LVGWHDKNKGNLTGDETKNGRLPLGFRITLMARKELTKSKAREYDRASKKRKGQILDGLCEDTGWSRDNARRQLKLALHTDGRKKPKRKERGLKYSARSRQILANAWLLSGCVCGLYFVEQVKDGLLERLVKHKALKDGARNTGALVGLDDEALEEVRLMSPATIDRYLTGVKKKLQPLSKSTTKKSKSPLRDEIPFGKSYAQKDRPGYLSTDTVAHCGDTLKGDHLWTLNSTDTLVGWTETITIKNRARVWIKEGHDAILARFPFPIIAINYDGGSEFINYEMVDYAKLHNYQMTRSRPYQSNDNAHVEQKNGDIVRQNAFRFRYNGQCAQDVLNELWHWVNLRKNYLVPTRKCIGHTKTRSGRTRGIYDKPKTPYRRVMEHKAVSREDKDAIQKIYVGLNDALVTKRILELQRQLIGLIDNKDVIELVNEKVKEVQAA
jgi:hypothetical protein